MSALVQPDPGYDWRCQCCNWQWRSRTPNAPAPKQCARCRSAYWTVPKRGKNDVKPDRTSPPVVDKDTTHLSVLRPPPVFSGNVVVPVAHVTEIATWPDDEPESELEVPDGTQSETPES